MREQTAGADVFLSLLHRVCLLAMHAMRFKGKTSIKTVPYFSEDVACGHTGRAYPDGCGSTVSVLSR